MASNTKKTAVSPANIAFIKYWGKKDSRLNLPFNSSISMNLSNCLTKTTIEFITAFKKTPGVTPGDELNADMSSSFKGDPALKSGEDVIEKGSDRVFIDGKEVFGEKKGRVVGLVEVVRKRAKISGKVKVVSENNFPKDAGIASSASAFSALALAASSAAGLDLSLKELSTLSRLGSGSACRSIVDGFAEWKKGKDSDSSYAVQLAVPSHWDLRDIVAIVASEKKKKSSTEGHAAALTSPHYQKRQRELNKRTKDLREVLLKRQFEKFGELLEEEAISLHIISMTSRPPIYYWNKGTIEVIQNILKWRKEGLMAYFTMDAGSNVHVVCRGKDSQKLNRRLKRLPEVLFTIVNKPAKGARLTEGHLF